MQNITVPKFLKTFLKIFVLFGLSVQIAYLFFAVRDLPFILSFPDSASQKKKYPDYAAHFEYYVHEDRHSPFLMMQERYLDLARSSIMASRSYAKGKKFLYTLEGALKYYKAMFKKAPDNGYIAFLMAEGYFLKSDYASSAEYLMKSYALYPVSGRIARARHKLSFRILPYLPKTSAAYREQDFKTIQLLNNGGE